MKRLAFLVVLVVAVPVQAQDLLELASLQATHLDVTDHVLTGTSNALVYEAQDAEKAGAFDLQLTAQELHVEVDHSQSLVHAAGANVYGTPQTGSQWTTTTTQHGTLHTTQARPNFHIAILADELGIHLAGACLAIQRAVETHVPKETTKYAASARTFPQASVADTLQAASCGSDTATMHGTLTLILWETDFTVGDTTFHTGTSWQAMRNPTGQTEPIPAHQLDQAYITAHNATLTLARHDANPFTAYLHAASTTASTATVAATAGVLDTQVLQQPRSIRFQGLLHLDVQQSQDSGFGLRVQGEPGALRDGRLVTLTQATQPPHFPVLWLMPLPVGLALALFFLLRRRPLEPDGIQDTDPLEVRGRNLFNLGHPRLAIMHLHLSLLRHPTARTRLLVAKCHYRLGHLRRCTRHALRCYTDGDQDLRADAAYLASRALAMRHHHDQALEWLTTAAQHRPRLVRSARSEPAFHALRGTPAFRELLRLSVVRDVLD
jgi:hypothetical protein